MVKLYVADISNLPDSMLNSELLHRLPQQRQQRIHDMKQEKSRKQSMGVGLLLQKVLALYHIHDSHVNLDKNGKPVVEGLEFNLSHSGDLVICAVSDKPVGCDVEELREAPKGMAERYFSEREQVFVNSFSGDEYNHAFFQIWTMRESYVKMTGEGLRLPFKEYEVVANEDGVLCFEGRGESFARVLRDGEEQACCLGTMEWQGYIISICAEDSAQVEVVWENL